MTAQAASSVESFLAPASVDEAIARKTELGDAAVFLAGGTDLGVVLRRRLLEPAHLIDLSRIEELHRLERSGDEIVIGATVTHRAVERSPLFTGHAAALQEACATVGSVQTRTVGTLGGNLCNASPAADAVPVLLALDAVVEIAGPGGRRTLPLSEFFDGYRTTALRAGELVTAIRVPVAHGRGSAFLKLGRRRAMEISIACAAVRIDLAPDGTIAAAGVGLGSVGPTSLLSTAAAGVLAGGTPGPDLWRAAGEAAATDCSPIDDVRATGAYRAAMVPVIVARAAELAFARAGGGA